MKHGQKPPEASRLDERLAWTLSNTAVGTYGGWCRLAGISHGAIDAYFRRLRNWAAKGGTGATPSMKLEYLERLADAARVSPTWLATGRGAPERQLIDDAPRDDAFEAVTAAISRGEKPPERAVDEIVLSNYALTDEGRPNTLFTWYFDAPPPRENASDAAFRELLTRYQHLRYSVFAASRAGISRELIKEAVLDLGLKKDPDPVVIARKLGEYFRRDEEVRRALCSTNVDDEG